jgi:Na+-driven multidrug efflux pump
VNFILNLFAIRVCGITGAAITTLVSQIVVAFISPLLFKQTRVFDTIYFNGLRKAPQLISPIIKTLLTIVWSRKGKEIK